MQLRGLWKGGDTEERDPDMSGFRAVSIMVNHQDTQKPCPTRHVLPAKHALRAARDNSLSLLPRPLPEAGSGCRKSNKPQRHRGRGPGFAGLVGRAALPLGKKPSGPSA